MFEVLQLANKAYEMLSEAVVAGRAFIARESPEAISPEATKVRRWLQANIRDAERDDLLDPRAGVEHARQERVVAPITGSGPVDRREHGLDLGELQVRNWTRAGALEGHGQHPLALLHSVWVLGRTVPKECMDGRKPHVSGCDDIVPLDFESMKEVEHFLGAKMVDVQLGH